MTSPQSEGSFRINGAEIHFQIIGDGEPLLLLHGFTGSGSDWQFVFNNPPPEYTLVMPDIRGHGRSTNPSAEFTHRQSAEDMFALLDRLGIERIKAVGLSAGGNTLLHMAIRKPARVEAMVVISATTHFPDQARAIMSRITPDNRTGEEWQEMRQRHRRGDEQIRALWRQANAFKDSYDDMNLTDADLSTITASTLIVYGDRDPFYPVEIAVAMRKAIPRSYLWVIPNGGHGPIFGGIRDRFVETATAFLAGRWGDK